jgi:hypothetical protein
VEMMVELAVVVVVVVVHFFLYIMKYYSHLSKCVGLHF